MTPDGAFDRRLTTWLEEDAAPRAPRGFDDVVAEAVNQRRQLPGWATPERWISMQTRAKLGVMPRVVIALLTIALLAIGAIGGYAIGSGLVDASDGGAAPARLICSTPEGVVYAYQPDGSGGAVPLTDDGEYAQIPIWSPDGQRFAYQSWAGPNGPITIMVRDADGSDPIAVSEPFDRHPRGIKPNYHAWSPDGSRLVFAAKALDDGDELATCGLSVCGQRIWSVPTDGSEPARVIPALTIEDRALASDEGEPVWTPDGESWFFANVRAPVWTPDGASIVFAGSAGRESGYGLYRMDADGANVERIGDLTGFGQSFDQLAISPDGTTLATDGTTAADGGGSQVHDIHLVDLASGDETLVAVGEWTDEFEPYWSPDGTTIAFTSWGAEPQPMLYDVVSEVVTPIDMSLLVVGWSPDGRAIVGQGPDEILTMADVTDPTAPVVTVVEGLINAEWPSWQPHPG